MPDSRRFKEDTIVNMTSLTLGKMTRSDAGEYSVTLKNAFGTATWTIKIIVLGLSLIVVFPLI